MSGRSLTPAHLFDLAISLVAFVIIGAALWGLMMLVRGHVADAAFPLMLAGGLLLGVLLLFGGALAVAYITDHHIPGSKRLNAVLFLLVAVLTAILVLRGR